MRLPSLLLLLALPACFYPADRGRLIEARLDKLTTEKDELKRQLDDTRERLAEVNRNLQTTLEQLDKASRRNDADIGEQLQKTVEDVASLRGQVETYQYRVSELESALKSSGGGGKHEPSAATDGNNAAAAKKSEELKRPDDPKEYFKLASDTARGGDKALARTLYNELIKKWPKDAAVGDAHFELGEGYFNEEKWRDAVYEYGRVIQDFPKAKNAPEAYLRTSDCFKKMKMAPESKLALEELIKSFPKSDAAKTGKLKLAELEKAAPKGADKKPQGGGGKK